MCFFFTGLFKASYSGRPLVKSTRTSRIRTKQENVLKSDEHESTLRTAVQDVSPPSTDTEDDTDDVSRRPIVVSVVTSDVPSHDLCVDGSGMCMLIQTTIQSSTIRLCWTYNSMPCVAMWKYRSNSFQPLTIEKKIHRTQVQTTQSCNLLKIRLCDNVYLAVFCKTKSIECLK